MTTLFYFIHPHGPLPTGADPYRTRLLNHMAVGSCPVACRARSLKSLHSSPPSRPLPVSPGVRDNGGNHAHRAQQWHRRHAPCKYPKSRLSSILDRCATSLLSLLPLKFLARTCRSYCRLAVFRRSKRFQSCRCSAECVDHAAILQEALVYRLSNYHDSPRYCPVIHPPFSCRPRRCSINRQQVNFGCAAGDHIPAQE